MDIKKPQRIVFVTLLTVMIIGFQNCGKTNFTAVPGATYLKAGGAEMALPQDGVPSTDENGNPIPGSEANSDVNHDMGDGNTNPQAGNNSGNGNQPTQEIPDDPNVAYSGACSVFKDMQIPMMIPSSAQDVVIGGRAGGLKIDLAKNVDLQGIAGHIMIRAADKIARISGAAGGVQANANEISSISNLAGKVCIHAMKVGTISGAAGGTKVIAAEIEEISNTAGKIHVYGGVIKMVRNNAGGICLHGGAKVLNYSNVAGFVGECQ